MRQSSDVLSRHAQLRLKQRGIPHRVLSALLDHADRVIHAGAGCETHGVSRKAIKALVADGALAPDDAARATRIVALLGGGMVVSVLRHMNGARGRRYRRQGFTRAARS